MGVRFTLLCRKRPFSPVKESARPCRTGIFPFVRSEQAESLLSHKNVHQSMRRTITRSIRKVSASLPLRFLLTTDWQGPWYKLACLSSSYLDQEWLKCHLSEREQISFEISVECLVVWR